MSTAFVIDQGSQAVLLTWLGDSANEALASVLTMRGFSAVAAGPGVEVLRGSSSLDDVLDVLVDASLDKSPPLERLLADAKNLQREKWDWALPEPLLRKAYASLYLDVEEAMQWVRHIAKDLDESGAGDKRN